MELLNDYLQAPKGFENKDPQQLANQIITNQDLISEADLVIIGTEEYRGAEVVQQQVADDIRWHLYQRYPHYFKGKILDLGNLIPGHSLADSHLALEQILTELLIKKIPVVLLGGSGDLTLPALKALERQEEYYTALGIDYKIDFGISDNQSKSDSYLNDFFNSHPKFLYQYLHAGIQSYHQNPVVNEFFNSVSYDATRLGNLRGQIKLTEPLFRLSNAAFFDFSSLKYCESEAGRIANVNGFYAEDFCQMARYAGFSDEVQIVGLFDIMEQKSPKLGAKLAAELIWCFLEALPERANENLKMPTSRYTKYTVALDEIEQSLTFYKSLKTNRWWLEAPRNETKNVALNKHNLIPCNEEDYRLALKNIIPEAWWISLFRSN